MHNLGGGSCIVSSFLFFALLAWILLDFCVFGGFWEKNRLVERDYCCGDAFLMTQQKTGGVTEVLP